MDSIRSILKRRDGLNDSDIDAAFDAFREDFQELIEYGGDPEELIADHFGLEPDYLFDAELNVF